MTQCSQLSVKQVNGHSEKAWGLFYNLFIQPLFDLYRLFKKYLGLYAQRVLLENLPKIQGTHSEPNSCHALDFGFIPVYFGSAASSWNEGSIPSVYIG
jgi:hypothetical protein